MIYFQYVIFRIYDAVVKRKENSYEKPKIKAKN